MGKRKKLEDRSKEFIELREKFLDVIHPNWRKPIQYQNRKGAAEKLKINPGTLDDWISGAYLPTTPNMLKMLAQFGYTVTIVEVGCKRAKTDFINNKLEGRYYV